VSDEVINAGPFREPGEVREVSNLASELRDIAVAAREAADIALVVDTEALMPRVINALRELASNGHLWVPVDVLINMLGPDTRVDVPTFRKLVQREGIRYVLPSSGNRYRARLEWGKEEGS
jgi:hypothetical protein